MPILNRSNTLTAMATATDRGDEPAILRVRRRQSIRSRMSDLILYQRDYCHLCDQALAVLAEASAPDFDSVWVDDSRCWHSATARGCRCCAMTAMGANWTGRSMKPRCAGCLAGGSWW
jgi:hypothetical protein